MATISATEKRLAVTTGWALCAPLGLCFLQSGFDADAPAAILCGFGVLVLGFISHIIINAVFRTGFAPGEVAVGFIAFGVALLTFVMACLFDRALTAGDIGAGIAGFAGLIAAFLVHLVVRFGLKGAFSQFHIKGDKRLAG